MQEPAQPKQPGMDTDKKRPGKGRNAEFTHGRGRPRITVHKVSVETLKAGLPGIHRIGGRG